jgi:NADH-quinone oxidoreductase subunit G
MIVALKKKHINDWVIEGPSTINRHSVISQGHYVGVKKPKEVLLDVMGGRKPRLFLDIHDVSEVNKPNIELSLIDGQLPVTHLTELKKINQQ